MNNVYLNAYLLTPLGPKPMKLMSPCPENLTLCTSWGPKRWKKCGYGSSVFTWSIQPSGSHPNLYKNCIDHNCQSPVKKSFKLFPENKRLIKINAGSISRSTKYFLSNIFKHSPSLDHLILDIHTDMVSLIKTICCKYDFKWLLLFLKL